jgi:hypothetical protein
MHQNTAQLHAYNHKGDKRMVAAFFGDDNKKGKVIQLFLERGIEVWELFDCGDGVKIIKNKYVLNEEVIHLIYIHGSKLI